MKRICLALVVIVLTLLLPWWVALVLATIYLFVYGGYELLIAAAAIDAYYGQSTIIPFYTLSVGALTIVAVYTKPYLSI